MEGILEIGLTIVMGLLLFCVSLIILAVTAFAIKWTTAQIKKIDASPALIAFGQSPTGQWVNNQLRGMYGQVDSIHDPFVARTQHLPVLKQLYNAGVLSPIEFSQFAAKIVAMGIELTDGVPNVDFKIVPMGEAATLPEKPVIPDKDGQGTRFDMGKLFPNG